MDLRVGDHVVTFQHVCRITELTESELELETCRGHSFEVARSTIVRPAVSRERGETLLARLAGAGSASAPLPASPEGRDLIAQCKANRDEMMRLWDVTRPVTAEARALDARYRELAQDYARWWRTQPVEAAVDDIRSALAIRLTDESDERGVTLMHVLSESSAMVFEELAMVCELPMIEVTLGVARAHRATGPISLAGHIYLGPFDTSGPIVVLDPCYVGTPAGPARRADARFTGKPGRFHAWLAWSEQYPTGEELVVAHESALGRIHEPAEPLADIYNDASMLGVFDSGAAHARLGQSLSAHLACGAAIEGIVEGHGVVATTEGDGRWRVRACFAGDEAVVVRVELAQ